MTDKSLREALEGLVAKWRKVGHCWTDNKHNDGDRYEGLGVGYATCADELEAALAAQPSRGVSGTPAELRSALEQGMKAAEKRTGMHLIAHYHPYLDELEKAVAPLLAAQPSPPQQEGERASELTAELIRANGLLRAALAAPTSTGEKEK